MCVCVCGRARKLLPCLPLTPPCTGKNRAAARWSVRGLIFRRVRKRREKIFAPFGGFEALKNKIIQAIFLNSLSRSRKHMWPSCSAWRARTSMHMCKEKRARAHALPRRTNFSAWKEREKKTN